MSAGELEHELAGTPGRLIRERYRRAAELSKVRGKMSCLMINDIDAGLGHFVNTQVGVPWGSRLMLAVQASLLPCGVAPNCGFTRQPAENPSIAMPLPS
jgi:hypothetical protein